MKRLFLVVSILMAMVVAPNVMLAPVAMATTIMDTTNIQRSDTGAWVDVFGSDSFQTTQIDVIFSGDDVKFQIHTAFPLGGIDVGSSHVLIADLALDLNGDGTFEKAVVLDSSTGRAPGLYSVATWYTAGDLWNGIIYYGIKYDESAPKDPNTRIKSYNTFDSAITVVQDPTTHEIDFTLSGVNAGPGRAWNNFNLFWGTGSCDNDGIAGTATNVPEPATMLLLGSGLIGLAGFARRKFKK